MYFAQFYNRKLDDTLKEAVGDRGVLILDGRTRVYDMVKDALEHAVKYGFNAYTVREGRTISDSREVSGPWVVSDTPGARELTSTGVI